MNVNNLFFFQNHLKFNLSNHECFTGFWYRGVVLDIDGTDYTILMVDFGNETTVPCDKIRKFPAKLQNIPILGLPCDFKSKLFLFKNFQFFI